MPRISYPTVEQVLAAQKKIKPPDPSDIRDAWKLLCVIVGDDDKAWAKQNRPAFDKAVARGKLSLWPIDKAAKLIRVNDYKRRVDLESINNPVIVAKIPGARYYEMLDGSHRLISRAEAGYSDLPVFLIELPREFEDLMDMSGDTLEDLGKYPTVSAVLSRKRPTEKDLLDTLKMMREMGLVPTGKGPATKPSRMPPYYLIQDSKDKLYYLVTKESGDVGRWWIIYPEGGNKPLGEFKGDWHLLSGQEVLDEGTWRDYVPLAVIQEVFGLLDPEFNTPRPGEDE
jgi:hypothetical protein